MPGVFWVCAESHLAASLSEPWRCACRLAETEPSQATSSQISCQIGPNLLQSFRRVLPRCQAPEMFCLIRQSSDFPMAR